MNHRIGVVGIGLGLLCLWGCEIPLRVGLTSVTDTNTDTAAMDVVIDTQPGVDNGPCVPRVEICNRLDDDCNGLIDDGLSCTDAGLTCATNTADCDADRANGCEVNLTSDPFNCGGCAVRCVPGTACNAGVCAVPLDGGTCRLDTDCSPGQVCRSGTCIVMCTPVAEVCNGRDDDCDGLIDDGLTCTDAGMMCAPGTADCNANPADNCETDLQNDASNCGSCGASCATGQRCAVGVCR